MTLLGQAVLCSFDTLLFSGLIGIVGHPSWSRRKLIVAFAGCDLLGSLLGMFLCPLIHFTPMYAFPFVWVAYAIAAALVLSKPRQGPVLWFVTGMLGLDNLAEAWSGGASVTSLAVSTLISGVVALAGCSIGALVRTKLVARRAPAMPAVGARGVTTLDF